MNVALQVPRADHSPVAHFQRVGEIVWLLTNSPMHERARLDEVAGTFLHPMALGQMRRWSRRGVVVGLATWAHLGRVAETRYLETGKVAPDDWASGDRLWFIDVIAPFGGVRSISRELRQIIPQSSFARSARWWPDGKLKKVWRIPAL